MRDTNTGEPYISRDIGRGSHPSSYKVFPSGNLAGRVGFGLSRDFPLSRSDALNDAIAYRDAILAGTTAAETITGDELVTVVVPRRKGGRVTRLSKTKRAPLKRWYSLPYDVALSLQGGRCAMCYRPPGKTKLHRDHDHKTMLFRGLLHIDCNLGRYRENPTRLRQAADYFERGGHPLVIAETARRLAARNNRSE